MAPSANAINWWPIQMPNNGIFWSISLMMLKIYLWLFEPVVFFRLSDLDPSNFGVRDVLMEVLPKTIQLLEPIAWGLAHSFLTLEWKSILDVLLLRGGEPLFHPQKGRVNCLNRGLEILKEHYVKGYQKNKYTDVRGNSCFLYRTITVPKRILNLLVISIFNIDCFTMSIFTMNFMGDRLVMICK